MEEEIRYLKPEEKEKARALWSQAFFEDSEEFDNYYFTEKIKENQILVKEEDGRIISMVHLNPYKILSLIHILWNCGKGKQESAGRRRP